MNKKLSAKQIHILNIAEELISNNGFEETSIREISKKANINVAMISYYFGSKEKMMSTLYEYRLHRSKEKFSEFTQTINKGRPEMQIREIVIFFVSEVLKYKHFHVFVTQKMKDFDSTRDLITDFYIIAVSTIEKIIAQGISIGVFKKAIKSEDLIATIIGTVLFAIRNKNFYSKFLNCPLEEIPYNIEEKVKTHLLNCTFTLLGYEEV